LKVDVLFLDTTYCLPKHTFPSQHDAIASMIHVSMWELKQSQAGIVGRVKQREAESSRKECWVEQDMQGHNAESSRGKQGPVAMFTRWKQRHELSNAESIRDQAEH
jgi:hypothetical protein